MSDTPHSESLVRNPQVLVAVIGGAVTVLVTLITALPGLIEAARPPSATPMPLVVTATPIPQAAVATATLPPPTGVAALAVLPSDTPSPLPPTSTPLPLTPTAEPPTPTVEPPTATPTPAPEVLLRWDEVSFTVQNISGQRITMEGIVFSSAATRWEAMRWGPTVYDALPAGKCVRLRDVSVGQRQPPPGCVGNIWGLLEVGRGAIFWRGVETFDVLHNGTPILTCRISDGRCELALP